LTNFNNDDNINNNNHRHLFLGHNIQVQMAVNFELVLEIALPIQYQMQ